MQHLSSDATDIYIDAPPEAVYALVADVTRTPEYSPEIRRCSWLDGATGPAVGARFAAVNKAGRGPAWTNKPVVTVASPGREFAVRRSEKFSGTITWRYQLSHEGSGTRVEQSYEVDEPLTRLGWFIIGTLYGCKDRRSELRANMQTSLQRLKALVEAGTDRREQAASA
jgi:hypothetical protein